MYKKSYNVITAEKTTFESAMFNCWSGALVIVARQAPGDYIVTIQAADRTLCDDEMVAQVSDGFFEDCHIISVKTVEAREVI